ncbi:MAG: hypothetical protein GX804_01450 [Lentisphaerae bacterium]|jgi:hypothetical protein|nr:hypothetical protein [Lentisphaerota bacterium]
MKIKAPSNEPTLNPGQPTLNPETPQKGGAVIAGRHQLSSVSDVKRENFQWAAILACIATVLFIALLVMQWLDWEALKIA